MTGLANLLSISKKDLKTYFFKKALIKFEDANSNCCQTYFNISYLINKKEKFIVKMFIVYICIKCFFLNELVAYVLLTLLSVVDLEE